MSVVNPVTGKTDENKKPPNVAPSATGSASGGFKLPSLPSLNPIGDAIKNAVTTAKNAAIDNSNPLADLKSYEYATGDAIDPNSYSAMLGNGVTPAPTVDETSYGASTPKVSTYAEFLANSDANANEAYGEKVKDLDNLNAETLAKIESDRQKGVRNAANAFEQNRATYGANAEALRRMGLTGSGYSDYLESSAYAASRSEIGAINAGATESARLANRETNAQKMAALDTLNAKLDENALLRAQHEETEETNKKTAFSSLLAQVNSGSLTDYGQIQKLAADAGLSADEAQQLVNSAADYLTKSQKENAEEGYRAILADINAGLTDYDQIVKFAAEEGLSQTEAQQLVDYAAQLDAKNKTISAGEFAEAQNDVVGGIRADIAAGNISYEEGVKQLEKIQAGWFADNYKEQLKNPQNITDTLFAQAKRDRDNGLLSKDSFDEIESAYEKRNSVIEGDYSSSDKAYNEKMFTQNLSIAGNNFTIKLNGTKYKLESGGVVKDDATNRALRSINNDKMISQKIVFKYKDNLYIRKGDTFYYVDGQGGDKYKKNGYNDLLACFD